MCESKIQLYCGSEKTQFSQKGLCKAQVLRKNTWFVLNISSVPTSWPAAAVIRGERVISYLYWALKGSKAVVIAHRLKEKYSLRQLTTLRMKEDYGTL